MTIRELEGVVNGLERNLLDARKELHDAMIASCGFRVGDLVRNKNSGHIFSVLSLFITCEQVAIRYTHRYGGDDWLGVSYWDLIDERGNVLPPRVEGE